MNYWMIKKLRHKSNYECYRYVDDYFLFYNDEKVRELFMESLTKWLKEFKLQISPSKTEEFERLEHRWLQKHVVVFCATNGLPHHWQIFLTFIFSYF